MSKIEERNEVIPAKHLESIIQPQPLSLKFRFTFIICELTLQIENQNSFSGDFYDRMRSRITSLYPLSRDEFIRIWKSCLFIRSQELYLRFKGKSPAADIYDDFIKPECIPAPLAHLLKALGRIECPSTGLIADVIPPSLDESNLPKWAVYDEAVMKKWNAFMSPLRHRRPAGFESFPHIDDCEGKSILLTAMRIRKNFTLIIRSVSTTATRSDALIRICNDDLFLNPVRPFDYMAVQLHDEIVANNLWEKYILFYYGTC